jgi:hypothetical protein
MSRYNQHQAPLPKESKLYPKIHPVWRGIGFLLMILAPIMAYAVTLVFLAGNTTANWIQIPPSLIVNWPQDPMILVKVISTLFFTLIFMIVFQFIYFLMMRLFAPPRYGPLDIPPVAYKGKPYKR